MFIVENWKHEWALKKRAKIICSLTTQRKPNQTLLCDTFILFPYHWAHWNVLRQGAVSQINTALIRWATIYRRQTVLRSCLSLKQTLYVRNFHCIFVWESWFYLFQELPFNRWLISTTGTSVSTMKFQCGKFKDSAALDFWSRSFFSSLYRALTTSKTILSPSPKIFQSYKERSWEEEKTL